MMVVFSRVALDESWLRTAGWVLGSSNCLIKITPFQRSFSFFLDHWAHTMMETDIGGTGISIYVPITGTDEAVAVSVDHLPENVDEVLGILQAELAPLGLWLDFAKAYLQRGKEEQFRAILESGCSPGERKPGEPCGSVRARAMEGKR